MKIFPAIFFAFILDSVHASDNTMGGISLRRSQLVTCVSPGPYEYHDWYEMPTEAREAATVLGYSQVSWDLSSEPATVLLQWPALSSFQQTASIVMGCDAQCWKHCYPDGSTRSKVDMSLLDGGECDLSQFNYWWDELEEDAAAAAVVLGYSQIVWDMGGYSSKADYNWIDLTSEEQSTAEVFGYNEQSWENCM